MTFSQIYGLIGYPVSHSLSPLMHNAAFSHLKINAEYKLFSLKEEEIPGFLKSLDEKNIFGLNVTFPYKERIIPFLSQVSEEARLIGAVNTIKISPKGLEGYNTDGAGFLKHLTLDLEFVPQGKNVSIIGAGGASRAISVYLCSEKVNEITIFDIDSLRLSALVCYLKEKFKEVNIKAVNSIEGIDLENYHLLINATPIGMKEGDDCLLDQRLIHKNLLVYDLVYNPKETKLLKLAKDKGARVSNGLGMLLYQGITAFEIWMGIKAPKEEMREALQKAF